MFLRTTNAYIQESVYIWQNQVKSYQEYLLSGLPVMALHVKSQIRKSLPVMQKPCLKRKIFRLKTIK